MAAKSTLVSDSERRAGARFCEWFGHQTASDFGQWLDEYHLLRTSCALAVVPGVACVRVAGRDARDYLHRRLTASIRGLAPAHGIRAGLLTGEGRMLADLLVLCVGSDEFFLLAPPACAPSLAAQVERYVIREDCTIEDMSKAVTVLSVDGPSSAGCFPGLVLDAVGQHVPLPAHPEALVVRSDSLGIMGYSILVPATEAAAVWESLRKVTGGLCGLSAREAVRVESGVPLFGADMDETTIPLEAGLVAIIDFNKGCFPGQEIVARINNLGHPAKVMVGLRLEGDVPPVAGAEVSAGEVVVGRVTSSVWSPALSGPAALTTVKWAYREPGTTLRVNGSPAAVCALPLVPVR
jgi:folate-binding protein YgfZ